MRKIPNSYTSGIEILHKLLAMLFGFIFYSIVCAHYHANPLYLAGRVRVGSVNLVWPACKSNNWISNMKVDFVCKLLSAM